MIERILNKYFVAVKFLDIILETVDIKLVRGSLYLKFPFLLKNDQYFYVFGFKNIKDRVLKTAPMCNFFQKQTNDYPRTLLCVKFSCLSIVNKKS